MKIIHKDYNEYKEIQTKVNKQKINIVWVKRETIVKIKEYCDNHGIVANNILCHGTRNGAEQKYFKDIFKCNNVLGSEISDTATQFENTIQWDFHDIKDEWIGAYDIIYSNSWDHAFDFELAINNWIKCTRGGGIVVLEYTKSHEKAENKADCFGGSKEEIIKLIEKNGGIVIDFFDANITSERCPKTELIIISNVESANA